MLRRAFLAVVATLAGTAVASPAMAADKHTTTVFVAGDSTAATWPAGVKPKAGWGQALAVFLDQRRVRVRNLALSGASSKSFVEAGLLDQILCVFWFGVFLFVSFGHNDEKTDDRHSDPNTTFQQYLSMYIDGARAHHAQPVLVTPVERRRFDADGHAKASHGDYPAAMLDLAAKAHVPSVDLTSLSMALWASAGVEGTKSYFLFQAPGANPNFPDGVEDNTHFQAHGAIEVAHHDAKARARQRILPVWDFTCLGAPVPDDALVWPGSV